MALFAGKLRHAFCVVIAASPKNIFHSNLPISLQTFYFPTDFAVRLSSITTTHSLGINGNRFSEEETTPDDDLRESRQRQFFTGEPGLTLSNTISLKDYHIICKKLKTTAVLTRLSHNFRRSLCRLPAAAASFDYSNQFVDEILPVWWKFFSNQLDVSPLSSSESTFYTQTELAVMLNSFTKLNKATNGKALQQIGGWPGVQRITDTIFEGNFDISYRTSGMLLRNIHSLIVSTKGKNDEQDQVGPWQNVKLRRFMTKFYEHLEKRLHDKSSTFTDDDKEDVVLTVSHAIQLGVKAPWDERDVKNLALLFYDYYQPSSDNMGNNYDDNLVQLIRLSKLITICVQWDLDVEAIVLAEEKPDDSKSTSEKVHCFWANVFSRIEHLDEVTRRVERSVVFRQTLAQNCFRLACKFGQEKAFASHLRRMWLDRMNKNTLSQTNLELLLQPLRQGRLASKAAKYSDKGLFANLFTILEAS